MKPMFQLTKSLLKDEAGERISYGIAETGSGCINIIVQDISADKAVAEAIVERCNKFGAAPEHISDIVYDTIAGM